MNPFTGFLALAGLGLWGSISGVGGGVGMGFDSVVETSSDWEERTLIV